MVSLVRLVPAADMFEVLSTCDREGIIAADWQWGFELDLTFWVWSDDGDLDADASLAALPGLVAAGDRFFVADGDWMEWEELVSVFPEGTMDEFVNHVALAETAPEKQPSVYETHPWLLDYLGQNPWMDAEGSATAEASAAMKPTTDVLTNDAEAAEVFDILMRKRAEWREEGEGTRYFGVDLLGGRWTKEHVGVDYDAFRGFARKGEPEQFCERSFMQKSFRCGLRSMPEPLAHLICSEWGRKMHWLFENWLVEGDGADYSDASMAAYDETPAIAHAWAESDDGPIRERIRKIRSMRPMAPA